MSQKEDKARIYNSREWARLRRQKMEANPICERCYAEHGWIVPARVIHHRIPIETARNYREMWTLAVECGLDGLQSLCFQCHSDIHKAMDSRSRESHKASTDNALARWAAEHQPTAENSGRTILFQSD